MPMSKRSRELPPTVGGNTRTGRAKGKEKKSSTKQSRLNFHAYDSSDSDDKRDFASSSGVRSRPKPGHLVQNGERLKKEVSAAPRNVDSQTEFITRGVKVIFPFKPYKSQVDMMSSIIEALQKQENALLESPTGSGKSLALLCGALAWLESQKEALSNFQKSRAKDIAIKMEQQGIIESPYFAKDESGGDVDASNCLDSPAGHPTSGGCGSCSKSCNVDIPSDAQDKSLIENQTKEQQRLTRDGQDLQFAENASKKWKKAMGLKYESDALPSNGIKPIQDDKPAAVERSQPRIPKIYFGSRTHKQITQLVKELKSNTVYRPKMAVLGSRNHYCINPDFKNVLNKNDACQELLDSKFDDSDLALLAACPYFASRTLALEAELIFCPYSYLIDPHIRKAMEIDLENSIVILDEAHNIEDAARDAGGLEITDEDLKLGVTQFSGMCGKNFLANSSQKLQNLAQMFLAILENQTKFTVKEYEQSTEIWTSQDLLSSLEKFGLDRHTIYDYERACHDISKAIKDKKELEKREKDGANFTDLDLDDFSEEGKEKEESVITASPRILRIMEAIIAIISRLLDTDLDCLDDYKIALVESVARSILDQRNAGYDDQESSEDGDDGQPKKKKRKWQPKRAQTRVAGDGVKKLREFKFWCLNPGVIFRPISLKARSVILTSGTLSPMESFASELQTSFTIQLEADHVIDRSQVWTGVLPYGPTQVKMDGTFHSAVSFPFQDELGRVVERIIEATPHGVLCFLSSYTLMDNLMTRWRVTGQYKRLCAIKKVFQEPRKATNKQFDKILKDFYNHISMHVAEGSNGGALLFAVFRGKCSEGIDFTDSNCRAVLAVSIPFPGLGDLKIKLKKEYNDLQSMRHRQQSYAYNNQAQSSPHGLAHVDLQRLNHSTGTSNQSANSAVAISKLSKTRSLLSGRRWYEIQAFRAYNQAIGRCIRHQRDWGAMVLLDHRLTQSNNQQNLSKWVRPLVRAFRDFESGVDDMKNWIEPLHAKTSLGLQVDTEAASIESEPLPDSVPTELVDAAKLLQEAKPLQEVTDSSSNNQEDISKSSKQTATDMPSMNHEHLSEKEFTDRSAATLIEPLDPQYQSRLQDLVDADSSADQEWDNAWVLNSEDDLLVDSEVTESKLHCSQIIHVKKEAEEEQEDDWGPGIEADITADFDSYFEEDMQNKSDECIDEIESSYSSETAMSSPNNESIVEPRDLSDQFVDEAATLSPFEKPNASFAAGMDSTTQKIPSRLISHVLEENIASHPGNSLLSSPQAPSTSSSAALSTSQIEQSGLDPWGSVLAIDDINEIVPQTRVNPFTYDTGIATQVVCKVCSQPLLSCSKRPKIKVIKKSMAAELLLNKRRIALGETPLGNENSNSAFTTQDDQLSSAEKERSSTGLIGPGHHSTSYAMILTVQNSHVLEMFFETQHDKDELDCVWRPRDGLFYQRIICPKCRLACNFDSSAQHQTIAGGSQSERAIVGWKGVVIVGRNDGGSIIGDDVLEVGTIWLTPGEIKVV
ncbi:Fanconi anemia group J protein [Mortierella sp. AD011]|nr:Fanconi anemia group J protein [Mortierella sp. AD011]